MTIAIDYFGTYTRAPAIWDEVIQLFREAGHTVICVTQLLGNKPPEILSSFPFPVVFAKDEWKKEAALKAGYKVDIWIEDMPEFVSPAAIQEYAKKNRSNTGN